MAGFLKKLNNLFLHINLQEQILFARHLSIMSKAGISLLDSLNLLKKQARSKAMREIISSAAADVANGQFLSDALKKFSQVFGDLFINIIHIGETSGTLPENLNYLSQELVKKRQLRSKVKGALVYPIIIMIGTAGILILLTVFIFPKIMPVFQSMNIQLPLPTRILISVANITSNYGLGITLSVIAFIILLVFLKRIKPVKRLMHLALLYTPIVGLLSKNVNLANFCRTLGLLMKSGVKIIEAIGTSGGTLENIIYKAKMDEAADYVRSGQQLSAYLAQYPNLFPAMLTQMMGVGEGTGNLSETLLYLADYYEEEIDNTTKNLSSALEPALLIIMGLIVGFVAIAIITPIYGITQGVR